MSSAVKSPGASSTSLSNGSQPSLSSPTETKCLRLGASARIFSTSPMPSGPEIIATEPECSALNLRSSERSCGAQGIAIAPSLSRPVRVACHSGTLPSSTITLSPRPTPISRAALANRSESLEKSPKVIRRSSPSSPSQIMARPVFAPLVHHVASEVEPLWRLPGKPLVGGRVVADIGHGSSLLLFPARLPLRRILPGCGVIDALGEAGRSIRGGDAKSREAPRPARTGAGLRPRERTPGRLARTPRGTAASRRRGRTRRPR